MSNYRFPNLDLLLKLHNNARQKTWFGKIADLQLDEDLIDYAMDWAGYMSSYRKLKHSEMRDISRLGFSPVAENIAYGQKNEESVMNTWLWSPGHKRNIMNKSFTHIGCGLGYSTNNTPYWCVCFGKKKNSSLGLDIDDNK
jgi:uncharacterized protein YkwD|tara:strand:+ start:1219 stop:1641 length:423 start_codon:yes stop_codon:yes gene_type:complete